MSQVYKVKEVFNRGMPTVTYVDRGHLGLERKLQNAVAKGHAIIAITGPSKCGKTVLRKRVIPDNAAVRIEGGQISVEDDFWSTIGNQLELPVSRTDNLSKQITGNVGWGGSVGPTFARLSGNFSDATASIRGTSQTFGGAEKSYLLSELLKSEKVLVIDDFHYMEDNIRANIVRALKGPVFDGLPVVMLSVPYRAFDVLAAEAEMEGRFSHLTIPAWFIDDLKKIAHLGFPAMGMRLIDARVEKKNYANIEDQLAHDALGSPLLMQSLCVQLCVYLDIFETEIPTKNISVDDSALHAVYEHIAKDFGLPSFEKLARGPERGPDRIPREFRNSTKGDIYEAVLAAIAFVNAYERITYDEIRNALRAVLCGEIPQKHEIIRSIKHMCSIARTMHVRRKEKREGEHVFDENNSEIPAIDWKDDVLYLNDVFLRFYLRWVHREKIAPPDGENNSNGDDDDLPF